MMADVQFSGEALELRMPRSSDEGDPVGSPRDPDKALSAAFLRMLGHTQVETASAVGVSERSIVLWEQCSWWADMKRIARDRWLSGLEAKARRTLLKGADEDPAIALKIIERLDVRLLPPKQQVHHEGEVTHSVEAKGVLDQFLRELEGVEQRAGSGE